MLPNMPPATVPAPFSHWGRGGAVAAYYASVGPARGPLMWRDAIGAVGVQVEPGNVMPCGMALGKGPDSNGVQTWELFVNGQDLPGRWIVVDREFHPVKWRGCRGQSRP